MNITIERKPKTFNVAISQDGADKPFLVIRGCRIANGPKGRFVSFPSAKLEDGKYFNYIWADREFSECVLVSYDHDTSGDDSEPVASKPTSGRPPKAAVYPPTPPGDEDIPF